MYILFRVDSSDQIGAGHLLRCLNLAKELKAKKKAKIVFFCKNLRGNLNYIIKKNKFKLVSIPVKKKIDKKIFLNNHFLKWPKEMQEFDSNFLKKKIKKKVSFIIVDHYALDYVWEKKISLLTKKIVVIDDLSLNLHYCHYYINYHNFFSAKKLKKKIILNYTKILNGIDYVLTSKINKILLKKNNKKIIFIYMGSVDKQNNTLKLIQVLKNNKFSNFVFKVLVGKNNSNYQNIYNYSKKFKNINIFNDEIKNYKSFFKKIDNVITAGGVSMYELIMLGFRPIVIVQNKYQQKICDNLSEKGLIKKINNKKIDLKNLFLFLSTNKNFYENNNNNNIKKISNGIKNIIRHIK